MGSNRKTIGILSRVLDGFYFGRAHYHIHQVAQQHGARVIAVRTNDEHQFCLPIALDQVDGWIIMSNAVSEPFIDALVQRNIPFIFINSPSFPNYRGMMIDNSSCVQKATEHLLDHGHSNIAFIGNINNLPTRQRFEGYRAALLERSVTYQPELTICVSSNEYFTGREGASSLLNAGRPFTALVTANDTLALGAMYRFQEVGLGIPKDIAIVGFDNISLTHNANPTLTTIHNPTEDIARQAAIDLFLKIQGEILPDKQVIFPTRLVIRSSCGCGKAVSNETPESLHGVNEDMKLINYLESVMTSNVEVGKTLTRMNKDIIDDFSSFLPSNVRMGCLGLWDEEEETCRKLRLTQIYRFSGDESRWLNTLYEPEQFPPPALFMEGSKEDNDDCITLIPLRTERRELGMLVLASPLDFMRLHRNYDALYDLFAFAIERETLIKELRAGENTFRMIAEHLEIVSSTSNDGIWEYDLLTQTVRCNDRLLHILGTSAEELFTVDQLFGLIHPKHRAKVWRSIETHLHTQAPFRSEFRIKRKDGHYLWVVTSGAAIRNAEGIAIQIIGSIRDETERKRAEEQNGYLAYHDSLTGLPNRVKFQEVAEHTLHMSRELGGIGAVILLDLDRFKNVNDTFGHQMGDRLLQHVARQLKKAIAKNCTVARISGDEFIVLIPHLWHRDDVTASCAAILNAFTSFVDEGHEFFISASLGVSLFPEDGEDVDTLIKHADLAMYQTKSLGGNSFSLYTSSMNEGSMRRLNLENSLHKAIERSEFVLHYQPVFDITKGTLYAMEALIRWNSPDLGIVSPLEFIPLAEETGLIIHIGTWVLWEACRQYKHWEQLGYLPPLVSVNISANQFKHKDFASGIMTIIEQTGMDPARLCLEITESIAIEHMEYSKKVLEELIRYGIHISLDDFGTGYSSLSILKQLPIHTVKIDQSFIKDMTADRGDLAIVKAIVAMSHSMNMNTLAEGVETDKHLQVLKQLKCHYAQGYLFSKPISAEQFEREYLTSMERIQPSF